MCLGWVWVFVLHGETHARIEYLSHWIFCKGNKLISQFAILVSTLLLFVCMLVARAVASFFFLLLWLSSICLQFCLVQQTKSLNRLKDRMNEWMKTHTHTKHFTAFLFNGWTTKKMVWWRERERAHKKYQSIAFENRKKIMTQESLTLRLSAPLSLSRTCARVRKITWAKACGTQATATRQTNKSTK